MTTKMKLGLLTMTTVFAACGGAPSEEVMQESADLSIAGVVPVKQLAYGRATGLYESTGNLYWTANGTNSLGEEAASFIRMSKTNVPGEEVTLYTAGGIGAYSFGNVVWALEDTYYGYFSVTHSDGRRGSGSQIVRVPLAGGAATVVADSPALIGGRDVATDGAALYWADAQGIRKLSLTTGGGVTTLAPTTTSSNVALDGNYVYFGEGDLIQSVPKGGGIVSTMVTAAATVTALSVDPVYDDVYWGETGGAIRRLEVDSGYVRTFQNPVAGRSATSVVSDGTRTVWIDCAEPGDVDCHMGGFQSGYAVFSMNLSTSATGAGHAQTDAARMYWGDSSGIHSWPW